MAGLAEIKDAVSKRESSWDRSGQNDDYIQIAAGKTATIAKLSGAGCVRHIWFTIACDDPHYLRKLILRAYWDGEKNPSIECPVGDFFGVGHAVCNHFVSLPLNMVKAPGKGQQAGMNCFFPMPFSHGAVFTITNESNQKVIAFYYYIDYEKYDSLPDGTGRFHAQWRRENPCKAVKFAKKKGQSLSSSKGEVNLDGKENYTIFEAQGQGHYVGCVLSVDNMNAFHQNYTWFGEGDDMIFIDGEKWPPSLHGTGTEDYFCAAWGYVCGKYDGLYHGISLAGDPEECSGKWTMYRFHIEDPVRFKKSIRVTIEHGHANDQGNDYSSVGYWYQAEPHRKFPALLPVEKRLPNPRHR
jgi:hypothetical protein